MNSDAPPSTETLSSSSENSVPATAPDEGAIAENPSPETSTRIEQAETRTEQAEARTEQAEARTEEAKTRIEQAEIRTEQAETRTEQAKSRTEQAELRTEQAETRTEQAIRASELSYRRLFEAAKDGILILEADTGCISDVNPFLIETLGFSHGELVGTPIWELGPFRDIVSNKAKFEQLRQQGYVLCENLPLETKAGRKIAVEFVSTVYQAGDHNVIQCNVRDITERNRSDARFRRLVDSNVQGVIFWNTKGQITEGNDAFLRLINYTREEMDAGPIDWVAMTPPKYAELDRHAMQEIAATGICTPYEKEFIRKDGSSVPVLMGAAVFEDNPEEGVCFVLDLTERKKLEHQFLRAQRMESIGTLAGGIAHDLNNILAPIMMSIGMLKELSTDPKGLGILETIELSAKRGADIVRQVLSFARGLEGERIEVQPEHLLKDLENIIKDTFPKNIDLKFSIPDETWMILGDPTQVHQILLNLCLNARDAMPHGGTLTLSAENSLLDNHYAAMNVPAKTGRYVKLSVTDSGTGMPPKIIDKIFEPFFTTKALNQGTGLGLSTVMAIVKSHDGVINVYSEPGQGTTFRVYLPALEISSEEQKKKTQVINVPRGNGETVLVVDDEASILTITSQTLQAFGYRVIMATNGAEAVALYAQHRQNIAVVLTDMAMPIMDGPATIHALMQINPAIKIIGASGFNANGNVATASSAGIKHFLTKPYTAGALLKMLRATLDEV